MNNRKTLKFQVRWAGYDSSEDTWEPYANLRHAIQLHEYLRAIKRIDLIPESHRNIATPIPRK